MEQEIRIRDMTEADQTTVSEILCVCYHWLGEEEGLTAEQVEWLIANRGSIETVRTESRSQRYMIACRGSTIVGMVAIDSNEITKLYVDPQYHRQGIGRALFETAENIICNTGFDEVTCGSTESAVPFYEAMGMSVVRRKPCGAEVFAGRQIPLMAKPL